MTNKYNLKTDDLLLRLLRDYHNISASEAMSFFGERANEMLKSKPNITENSRSPKTYYVDQGNIKKTITFTHKYNKSKTNFKTHLKKMETTDNKVYVLRGFYPRTHLPFKMTLVKFNDYDTAIGKVIIGLKQHHTLISEENITNYNDAVTEAILLDTSVKDDNKIKYEYRKFKCMRPKGMKLYHEKK